MHQVNEGLIKPCTAEHAQLPGASYAVLRNLRTCGLRCDLFFSHAWDEGVYEFIDSALKHWPENCHGAYFCCLSNPQCLDLSPLHGSGLETSPFYKVLNSEPKPRMVMLANANTAIYERLWCVYEAHLAHRLKIFVRIATRCD